MTTTSTYTFNPSAGDIVLSAFGQLQIRRHELTTSHLEDAAFQANMLGVDISNRNPERWLMEMQAVPLVAATATYTLAARTISVTTAVLSQTGLQDRAIGPMSGADYSVVPDKTIAALPTAYWFSLAVPPTITVWPVPDAATVTAGGTLNLMTFRQCQDVDLSNGASVDCPYRFLDAFSTGLAARLAEFYRPEKVDRLNTYFEQRIARAIKRDQELVNLSISPAFSGYYR
jgi:hypothetical protein